MNNELARISHQVAECVMKKISSLSVYANFIEVSRKQTALGAPSLVFSPSARTYSLKRSHHYALGHEHALKAKSCAIIAPPG